MNNIIKDNLRVASLSEFEKEKEAVQVLKKIVESCSNVNNELISYLANGPLFRYKMSFHKIRQELENLGEEIY